MKFHQENKRSIAFYIGDYSRSGGTERSCISVANGLAERGDVKVFLIMTNNKSEEPFFDINHKVNLIFLNIKNSKIQYFSLLNKLNSSLKKYRIDKLVAVEVMSLLFILPLYIFSVFYQPKAKLWVWEHFNFTVNLGKKSRDFLRRKVINFSELIVVLTQRDVGLWREGLKFSGNIVAINNPSPYYISEKSYSNDSKIIIAVGRLTFQKGFDRLLSIWGKFLEKFPEQRDWTLQIIGSGPDQELLEEIVSSKSLHNNVKFIPNTSKISDYYEKASLLAMTSRFEGLPMTLIEAQSFGLPIISYDCLTGPSDVISLESGYLIKDDDESDFVDKLYHLTVDENLRLLMSENAKKEVAKYGIEYISSQWREQLINL